MTKLVLLAFLLAATAVGAQPVLVPDSRDDVGRSKAFRITSSILGQTRRILVALPPSFAKTGVGRQYPVAIVFDGESTVPAALVTTDELVRHGMIPEMIIVGIVNTGGAQARVSDLTPPGLSVSGSDLSQNGDRFLDFIERELLPAVNRQFRGGSPRLLAGHSSGAILATYAAATRPGFSGVIAIDAPVTLQQNWLIGKLQARAALEGTRPLRFAAYEANFNWPADAWRQLVATAPASWKLRRESMRLEGHETVAFPALYQGFREIFSDYSRLAAQAKPASAILGYYRSMSTSLGADVVPPRMLLRTTIDELVSAGEPAEARTAFTLLVTGYGAPPDSADVADDIALAERSPRPRETVEKLLATPFPTPEQIRPYLGEWVGSVWMTPQQPRSNTHVLRVRIDGDRAIAETRDMAAPPELAGWKRVDYLRVTGQGLTYGRLNGMRPRGVMLWEGVLKGDTLSGRGRFGGVVFESPPDFDPQFTFVRKRP
jgi:pimeloyl-ACP methyl ester carboxylesterase